MPELKLTKSTVDALPYRQSGQECYWDTELKGFGLVVGKASKTFVVLRRVNGRRVKVSIDRHGVITLKQARDRAAELLVEMRQGVNPNAERKAKQQRVVTLQEAFDEYVKTRSPKAKTLRNDKSLLACHLSSWLNKPLDTITAEMVSKRHLELREKSGHSANNVFRLFRRIYNCANAHRDDTLPPNPVDRLSRTKQWAKVGRRQTIIADCDLPLWFRRVRAIDDVHMRNYLLLQFFTGLRKDEGLSLEWANVNLSDKVFTIVDTKNDKQLVLPMSDYLHTLFSELHDRRQGAYVFPSRVKNGKTPHLCEPKRQVELVRGKKEGTGDDRRIEFCLHDLRRVFKTVAADVVSKYASDRLTNHTSRDAGDGYVVLSTEKVREPMQAITTKLLFLTHAYSTIC